MSKSSDLIEAFIDESRLMGYEISGSVFKADYNGSLWQATFWIRPAKLENGEYKLPGRIGKARDVSFKHAVKKAIAKARRLDHE